MSIELHNKDLEFLLSHPEPVPYESITYVQNGETFCYTDCFEISLLRFLHYIFGKNGHIDMELLKRDMNESNCCKSLITFFEVNNKYNLDAEYYVTEKGLNDRAEWCRFLNNSKLFNYKKENRYEICASLENLFTFFRNYFPKNDFEDDIKVVPLTIDSIYSKKLFEYYQLKLNKLMNRLSYQQTLRCGLRYNIKFQDYSDKSYNPIYIDITTEIFINEYHIFDWQIYQFYNTLSGEVTDRITGHSDYRYSELMSDFNK